MSNYKLYSLLIICWAVLLSNTLSSVNCQTSIALNSRDDLLLEILDKMQSMQQKIERLEENERKLKESISVLIGTNAQFRLKIEDLTKRLDNSESNIHSGNSIKDEHEHDDDQDTTSEMDGRVVSRQDDEDNHQQRTSKRQYPTGAIAFTAYLDHVLQLGKEQPVIYNRVLLNEGNAYKNTTGIFRAPVPGIYLFSWAVTARKLHGQHAYDVWVKLVVNGNHQIGAVAESQSDADDNQGTNLAIMRLNAGDDVWTSHYSSSPDIFGDDSERTTSFSGFLLYELEAPPSVVG